MLDINQTNCDHFMIIVSQAIVMLTLNLHNAVYQYYFNKIENILRQKNKINEYLFILYFENWDVGHLFLTFQGPCPKFKNNSYHRL